MVGDKHSRMSQSKKFAVSLQYLKKEVDENDFLHADKHQCFLQVDFNTFGIKLSYNLILSEFVGMINHYQCTQSSKFVLSLHYVEKEVRGSFFDGSGQTCLKYSKYYWDAKHSDVLWCSSHARFTCY